MTDCKNNIGIAQFKKVSYEQYKADMLKYLGDVFKDSEDVIETFYNNIKLPKRATTRSAGYDFFAPFSFSPKPGSGIIIPTGIRCSIDDGWVLKLYPRSGQGSKYGVALYNTVGIIDGDYFDADNEGHIMAKITCRDECEVINMGIAFCQGIFSPYGITKDDETNGIRTGGFGSTDAQSN